MKRNKLIQLLTEYIPSAQEEKEAKERMLAFAHQHEDCFERSLEIGHFTASAWLLNKDKSKVLLMLHAKFNVWCQLGGHCDGDHDVLSIAVKEAQEESGIQNIVPVSEKIFDLDIHRIPANKKEKEHDHYDVRFLLQVTSNEQFIQNRESKELRWIAKNRDELPTDSLFVVRMFNKWTCAKFCLVLFYLTV